MPDANNSAAVEVSFEDFVSARNEGRNVFAPVSDKKVSAESTKSAAAASAKAAGDEEDDESAGDSATPDKAGEDEQNDEEHEDGDADKPRKKGGFQRRIERKDKQLREAQQRIADLEARAAAGGKAEAKTEVAKSAEEKEKSDPEPEPKDNETAADFLKRHSRWAAKQEVESARKSDRQAAEAAKVKATQAEKTAAWDKKLSGAIAELKGSDDYSDVQEALEDFSIQPSKVMAEFMLDSEVGGHIACWLATHEKQAAEIAQMGISRATRKLTEIEAQFAKEEKSDEDEDQGKDKSTDRVTTRASKPPTPVKQGSAARAFDPNSESVAKGMTAEEWIRQRNAQLRKKGR